MKLCQYILCASSKNTFENKEVKIESGSKIHHVLGMYLYYLEF